MTGSMRIKHTTRHDIAAIMSLLQREFPFDSDGAEPRIKMQISVKPGVLYRDRRPSFTLELDGEFAGYVAVKPFEVDHISVPVTRERGEAAVLIQVAVEPKFRGRGGGAALTDAAIENARAAGFTQLFSHIVEDDIPFYTELGFDVPAPGDGWSWIEKHTIDDVNFARHLGRANPADSEWVPILSEIPSVDGYPVLARRELQPVIAVVSFTPESGVPVGETGMKVLAQHVESRGLWDSIPTHTASELKKAIR